MNKEIIKHCKKQLDKVQTLEGLLGTLELLKITAIESFKQMALK